MNCHVEGFSTLDLSDYGLSRGRCHTNAIGLMIEGAVSSNSNQQSIIDYFDYFKVNIAIIISNYIIALTHLPRPFINPPKCIIIIIIDTMSIPHTKDQSVPSPS